MICARKKGALGLMQIGGLSRLFRMGFSVFGNQTLPFEHLQLHPENCFPVAALMSSAFQKPIFLANPGACKAQPLPTAAVPRISVPSAKRRPWPPANPGRAIPRSPHRSPPVQGADAPPRQRPRTAAQMRDPSRLQPQPPRPRPPWGAEDGLPPLADEAAYPQAIGDHPHSQAEVGCGDFGGFCRRVAGMRKAQR